MTKKIALIGSAPSSIRLAPHTDPSWEFYACSPGAYPHLSPTRVNAFFELHRYEPPWGYTGEKNWFTKDYIEWMGKLKCPVYMIEPVPEIPNSVAYPKDAMLEKFGPFFMGSSVSWMFAMAICAGATEISLWGIDMSANEEWVDQRPGCQYFVSVARAMGIVVTTPPESDLLRPSPLYGFCEVDPMHIKLLVRQRELEARASAVHAEIVAKTAEFEQMRGAISNNQYVIKTWVGDRTALRLAYENPPLQTALIEADPVVDEMTVQRKANGAAHVEETHP